MVQMHNGDQYHDVVIFAQQNKAHFSVKVHTRAADFHFYHIYLSCTLDNLQVKIPKGFGQINGRHYGFSPKFTVRALEGILVS